MIIVAGTITFDPANAQILTDGFEDVQAATLEEDGCLGYDYFLSRKQPGVVLMFEKWESDEALANHLQSPNMASMGALMGQLGISAVDVKKYTGATEGALF